MATTASILIVDPGAGAPWLPDRLTELGAAVSVTADAGRALHALDADRPDALL